MLTNITSKRINRIRVPSPAEVPVCFNRPVLRPANFGLYAYPIPASFSTSPLISSSSSASVSASTSTSASSSLFSTSSAARPSASRPSPFKWFSSKLAGRRPSSASSPRTSSYTSTSTSTSSSASSHGSQINSTNTQRSGAGQRPSHNPNLASSKSEAETNPGSGSRTGSYSQRNRRDSYSRARLDTQEPISHTLATMGSCDASCQVFQGTVVMINQSRFSDETWRNTEAVLWARNRAKKSGVGGNAIQKREFHSSERRQGWPLLWQVMVILKSSSALSVVQTIGRVALTLIPVALLKRGTFREIMKHLPVSEHPTLASMHQHMNAAIKTINVTVWALLIIPGSLFAATMLASMERTPVTGRWRLILLSPEEERGVAADLAGEGWRNEVANILTEGETEPLPRVIPLSDWRTQWVLQTWRHLESVVPLLQADDEEVRKVFDQLARARSEGEEEPIPYPPPSEYALMPRPRATTILHAVAPCISESMEQDAVRNLSEPIRNAELATPSTTPSANGYHAFNEALTSRDPPAHTLLGPPYSVLLVEKPEAANAFAYGFGPNGGGGVVVYSGFIDDILRKSPGPASSQLGASTNTSSNNSSKGLLSYFTGSSGTQIQTTASSSSESTKQQHNQQDQQDNYQTPTHYIPTAEQTTHLAILLAHELSHLLLSHHLETLSSNSILIPSVVGMFADLARTLAFPFTMLFGPFVNDALWEASKLGTGEVTRNSQACAIKHLEVEADVVGARLLAYAGFDARTAIKFWEDRDALETCAETQRKPKPTPVILDEQGQPLALDPNQQPSLWTRIDNWIPVSSSISSIKWPNWLKFGSSQTSEGAGTWFAKTGASHDQGSHPISAERVKKLKAELERWEKERVKHVQQIQRSEKDSQHTHNVSTA